MYLESEEKVQDLMLKQRRIVLPFTSTDDGSNLTAQTARFTGILAVDDDTTVTGGIPDSFLAIDSSVTTNGTGLVVNALAYNLGTVTELLAVQAIDPAGGAAPVVTLGRVTTNGNIEMEITVDAASGPKTYALVIDYMVER